MAVTLRSDRPTLAWRILPPVLWGARRGHRLIERNVYVYRRTYMIILSGFFEPVFYLVSIRLGLGDPRRRRPGRREDGQLRRVRGARPCWPRPP